MKGYIMVFEHPFEESATTGLVAPRLGSPALPMIEAAWRGEVPSISRDFAVGPGRKPTLVIESAGEALFVDLRQFCQRRLAALPAEARALYRSRVDGQAERWYRQGAATRQRSLLRRVVDQAFCSSWGDDALDLLGDLAFQDGRFDEALATYRQLVPDHPQDQLGLIHPDPSVDRARVAAKKLLCRAALGQDPPGAADLVVTRRRIRAPRVSWPAARVPTSRLLLRRCAATGWPRPRSPTAAGPRSPGRRGAPR
jgi:hypothetical protein